jgi:hypothetical protein
MSVTRLKRKHRKNIARANNKQNIIKNLLRTPVLKNVDLEELKSRFSTTGAVSQAVHAVEEAAASTVAKVKEVAAEVVAAVTPAAKEEAPATEAPAETSVFEKIKGFAVDTVDAVTHSDVVEKAKTAVSDAVDAVSHSDVVEKAKTAVSDAVDAVSHSAVVEKATELVSDAVDKVKEVVAGDKTAANATAFDDAEAVTKPVNEDGQEGEHPKPEIAL